MTIRQLEKTFIDELSVIYDSEEARNLAWLSISHVYRFSRMQYLNAKLDELSTHNEDLLLEILEELKKGKPLQYVFGETEFYGLTFSVNHSVLIPRPETEELVYWIIKEVKQQAGEAHRYSILDIGSGSGCISISLKKNIPQATVMGLDISPEAIKTAIKNSALNNTEVQFIADDILNPVNPEVLANEYDLIVSNPPYVTHAEKRLMHQNVLDFEPHLALFVENNDPLLFYKAISIFAKRHLKMQGYLFFEINEKLGDETLSMLASYGFEDIELRKDLRGNNRMIKARKFKD